MMRQTTLQAALHESERQFAHYAGRAVAPEKTLTQAAARSTPAGSRKTKPRAGTDSGGKIEALPANTRLGSNILYFT